MKTFVLYDKARGVNKEIHQYLANNKIHKNLSDQLSRASISVVLNIAEGNFRFSNKDKSRFLNIALGSASECKAIFDILEDLEKVSAQKANKLRGQLIEVIKIIRTMMKNLNNSRSDTEI